MSNEDQSIEFIRDLMVGKTEEEILDAEDRWRRYVLVVKRIVDRLEEKEDKSF